MEIEKGVLPWNQVVLIILVRLGSGGRRTEYVLFGRLAGWITFQGVFAQKIWFLVGRQTTVTVLGDCDANSVRC